MTKPSLPAAAAPSGKEVRAYILDFVAELGDLARAYDQPELAADLKRIGAAHGAGAKVEDHV